MFITLWVPGSWKFHKLHFSTGACFRDFVCSDTIYKGIALYIVSLPKKSLNQAPVHFSIDLWHLSPNGIIIIIYIFIDLKV
jgi:hypothetical protein